MTDDTVTVEVELERETHDALAADGRAAEALADLAVEEARLRRSIERYVGGGGDAGAGSDAGAQDDPGAEDDAGSGGDAEAEDGAGAPDDAGVEGDAGARSDAGAEDDAGAGDEAGAGSRVSPGTLADLPPPVGVLLGFDAVEAGDGRATVEMEAGPRHANPMGTLHGGVLCDLGDAAMGTAFASTLAEGETFATLELDAKYLKPVWSGRLAATAEVVGGGRTVGLVECDVTDEEGSLVARLQSVCLTLRGERAEGR